MVHTQCTPAWQYGVHTMHTCMAGWCPHNAHLHGSMVSTQCAPAWQDGVHTMCTCMAVWCTHNVHLHGSMVYTQCAPAWQYGVHTMRTCMAVWCTHSAHLHGSMVYTMRNCMAVSPGTTNSAGSTPLQWMFKTHHIKLQSLIPSQVRLQQRMVTSSREWCYIKVVD